MPVPQDPNAPHPGSLSLITSRFCYLCFILKTEDPFELPELTEGILFKVLGLPELCGKYPSPKNPTIELGGVLAFEVFMVASGL
jgi:hypothetical protein